MGINPRMLKKVDLGVKAVIIYIEIINKSETRYSFDLVTLGKVARIHGLPFSGLIMCLFRNMG